MEKKMSIAARTCDLPSLLTPSIALRAPASDDARALAVSPAVPTGLGPPSSSADLICASKRSQLRNPCSGMPHAKRVQLAQQAVCTPDKIQKSQEACTRNARVSLPGELYSVHYTRFRIPELFL